MTTKSDVERRLLSGQDGPGRVPDRKICDSTSGANSGNICLMDAGCAGGQCANNICLIGTNDGRECTFPSDCPSGGTCSKIAELARDIRETGTGLSGSLCRSGTTRNLRLASVFCIPATTSLPVNGAADLPGPGATTLRSTIRIFRKASKLRFGVLGAARVHDATCEVCAKSISSVAAPSNRG